MVELCVDSTELLEFIKYRMKVSMKLRVPFDRADLICLSSVDIVSLS